MDQESLDNWEVVMVIREKLEDQSSPTAGGKKEEEKRTVSCSVCHNYISHLLWILDKIC